MLTRLSGKNIKIHPKLDRMFFSNIKWIYFIFIYSNQIRWFRFIKIIDAKQGNICGKINVKKKYIKSNFG
jgi:hypothetical protein